MATRMYLVTVKDSKTGKVSTHRIAADSKEEAAAYMRKYMNTERFKVTKAEL